MTRGRSGRQALAAACLLGFLATGCTPTDPPPASSSPVATPTETAQEREERLAYEAAEKSYRDFRTEVELVYSRGGASTPTRTMLATAGGSYLKSYQEVSSAYHTLKHRSNGELIIGDVQGVGFEQSELLLSACEDSSNIITYSRKGKELYRGDHREVMLTVRLIAGSWKVWSGKGHEVDRCN